MVYDEIIQGTVVNEETSFSLKELCQSCGTHADVLLEMVDEGLLEPFLQQNQWRFSIQSLRRARIALNLQKDLGINLAGVAMVLDLLEEVRGLRQRIHCLEYQLVEDSEDIF